MDLKSNFYFELFSILKNQSEVNKYLNIKGNAVASINAENLQIIFKEMNVDSCGSFIDRINLMFFWGLCDSDDHRKMLSKAIINNIPIIIAEDGFIRSADTYANRNVPDKYRYGVSYTFDSKTAYFDGCRESCLERLLNSDEINLSEAQILRARKLIGSIIKNHLTKYNHQPIFTPTIGREGRKKILVVDQRASDLSITFGNMGKFSFKKMLFDAIHENPNADIIIKTHPDVLTGNFNGFYDDIKTTENIYLYSEEINPISLLNYVDKVYVGSSQMGFEALMCGKEVHVYGTPFYSNWGITHDVSACERRTRKRSLEEIFYIAYVMYTHYINPYTKENIEIEDAIDFLIAQREEYSNYKKLLKENPSKINESIICYENVLKMLLLKHKNENIILWGASEFLGNFIENNRDCVHNIKAIVDRDENKVHKLFHGISVMPLDYIENAGNCILVSTLKNNHFSHYKFIKQYISHSINDSIFLEKDIFN